MYSQCTPSRARRRVGIEAAMAARLAASTAVAASFRQILFSNVVASPSHPAIAACEIVSFRHALVTNAFAMRPPLVACALLHCASPAVDSSHVNSNPIRSTSRRGDSRSSACSGERAFPSARVFPVALVSVSLRPSRLLDSPVRKSAIPLAVDAALGIPQAVVALPHLFRAFRFFRLPPIAWVGESVQGRLIPWGGHGFAG
ncbi:unnamed protein product [Closterium sp. Yama58-4]|nr:unnamed protein product [Closterium sp. Yama58-4]